MLVLTSAPSSLRCTLRQLGRNFLSFFTQQRTLGATPLCRLRPGGSPAALHSSPRPSPAGHGRSQLELLGTEGSEGLPLSSPFCPPSLPRTCLRQVPLRDSRVSAPASQSGSQRSCHRVGDKAPSRPSVWVGTLRQPTATTWFAHSRVPEIEQTVVFFFLTQFFMLTKNVSNHHTMDTPPRPLRPRGPPRPPPS